MTAVASVLVPSPHNSERPRIGIYHAIEQSKTARRQRSLRGGAEAWAAEVRYRGGAVRGAVLLTLTFGTPRDDRMAASAVRRFWDRYDKQFARTPSRRCAAGSRGGRRCKAFAVVTTTRCSAHGGVRPEGGDPQKQRFQRLSWLEYQANGRHHYHAIILDPPPRLMGHDWRKVQHLWGEGRTQLLWRNAEWVDHTALRYAVSYSKKFGAKEYQQQYEKASKAIRTFQSNRLHSADARLARLPRWAYHAASEAGVHLVDGRRSPGGGLAVDCTLAGGDDPAPSFPARLRIQSQINWHERAWWPPGTVVVRLGEVTWSAP